MIAFIALAFIASPQPAQAAHGNYRVKTLKTYNQHTSSGSDVAFRAIPRTKATLWINMDSVNAKQIKPSVFHKKGIKIAKYKTTTWFVQKKKCASIIS